MEQKSSKRKQYYEVNKERALLQSKNYYNANKENIIIKTLEYNQIHRKEINTRRVKLNKKYYQVKKQAEKERKIKFLLESSIIRCW